MDALILLVSGMAFGGMIGWRIGKDQGIAEAKKAGVTHTIKGIAFAFVVALVLSVAAQAQAQYGPTKAVILAGESQFIPVWSGTIELAKDPDGRYNIGSSAFRYTDKTLANVWHENWEFHNGKLHILQPMEVVYQGTPVQIGRAVPDSYDVSPATGRTRFVYANGLEPQASATETICGKVIRQPSPGVDMIQASCVNFDGLRKIAPDIAWPEKARTEILVFVSKGDCVRVELDGVAYFGDVIRNSYGQLFSMITVDGVEFKTVSAKPKGDI